METDSKPLRIEIPVHIMRDRRARKVLAPDETGSAAEPVPRLARLLALAHKWERMVRRGETSCGEIARRHGLSGARVSQVCGLTLLAPAIQKRMLDEQPRKLPRATLRGLSNEPLWSRQGGPTAPNR